MDEKKRNQRRTLAWILSAAFLTIMGIIQIATANDPQDPWIIWAFSRLIPGLVFWAAVLATKLRHETRHRQFHRNAVLLSGITLICCIGLIPVTDETCKLAVASVISGAVSSLLIAAALYAVD